jgi:UDP-N-acetylmuramate--alanine ligase
VALEIGLPIETIKKSLLAFVGTKRRFEYVGKLRSGALAYDDYAHHPTEIQSTLKAFRDSFPGYKIVCIFQPHTYSRTKKLFEQFSRSFANADKIIISDIFPSLREAKDPSISSELLTQSVSKNHRDAIFLPGLADVIEYLGQNQLDEKTVVISMGAGDIYKIWKNLL